MAMSRQSWAWTPHVIHRTSEDEFFDDGNKLCQRYRRQFVVKEPGDGEESSSEEDLSDVITFKCQAEGCSCVFHSVQQYECHYNSQHRYPCLECRLSFPNCHLLDIHITEWHNPMFEEMSRIQNMFQCLLDTCPEKFQDYQHRKDHMIKIHKYPANFRFDKPPKIKRRVKKERKQIKRHKGVEVMDTEDTSSQNEIILDDNKMPLSLSKLAFGCLSAKNPDPRLVSGQPTGVTGQPIGVTGQPTGVTGQPIGVTGQPIGVTGQPTGVTGQPIGVTGQPTGVTGHSGCELSTDADVCDSHDDANVDMETKCSTNRRFVYKKSNVPRNICFGAGSQRGFYGRGHSGKRGRHWYQAKKENKSTVRNIEEVNMEEIGDALET